MAIVIDIDLLITVVIDSLSSACYMNSLLLVLGCSPYLLKSDLVFKRMIGWISFFN